MTTFPFDNSYARLPDRFYARVQPTPVRAARLFAFNRPLAEVMGIDLDELPDATAAQVFSGNAIPTGAEPIALAYAGHQFGGFVAQLGDGRAILLGEVVGRDGRRRDIQLKGAGRTPYSRGGDGRAAIGPVLREYVVSETMAALGVPTTRALAATLTGERIIRDQVLPGAVLTRVASSHLRVGTFQYFAARRDHEALTTLATYALRRHHPDAVGSGNDALTLLERVIDAQSELVARWLGVGFVHGVMNTDNTSISGETIDYGPCAFLDEYDPQKTFSSIDHQGRYAFSNQPSIALWNLSRFAETLLPLLSTSEEEAVRLATERLQQFPSRFEAAHARILRAKLGLSREDSTDVALAADLLELLATDEVDYTLFFRRLCDAAENEAHDAAATPEHHDASIPAHDAALAQLFTQPKPLHAWLERWRRRLASEQPIGEQPIGEQPIGEQPVPSERAASMRRANPAFIPRNHRIEEAIVAAVQDDFAPFETLVRVLSRPYDDQPDAAHLAEPPRPEQRVEATFCGT